MLEELVEAAATANMLEKMDHGSEAHHHTALRVDLFRGGVAVASVFPPMATYDALSQAVRLGAAGFEADAAVICSDARTADAAGNVEGNCLVCLGGNRAGDVAASIDIYRQAGDTFWWRQAPQDEIDHLCASDLGDLMREAMMKPTVLQLAVKDFPELPGHEDFPRERMDCIVAAFLGYEHECGVRLLAADDDTVRREGLRFWGETDWQWG